MLRNWELQGSNDGIIWITIRKHTNDGSLNNKSSLSSWYLGCQEFYSKFKIIQYDINDDQNYVMFMLCYVI